MRNKIAFRSLLFVCVALTLIVSALSLNTSARRRRADPPAIQLTPPAPVFKDDERVAELRARRERVAEKIGASSVLVMFSAEPRLYTNDVDFEFRQENNLYYLTNLNQQGATLVLLPGNTSTREILFLPRRVSARETWTGHMYGPEEAKRISGIGEIWDAKEFEPFMRAIRTRRGYRPQRDGLLLSDKPPASAEQATDSQSQTTPNDAAQTGFESLIRAMEKGDASLYLLLPSSDNSREYRQEQELAGGWARAASGLNVRSAWRIFAEMRMIKSPSELQLMQHAVDISIEGHERAQAVASRAQWEYEVEAEIDYTYKRRNADNWGYPNIVGCGPNGTTLHYEESQGRVHSGELILIDAGAEYGHYSADVTRTFPVSGKFSKEQTEIYNIVLAAQEASFRVVRPGGTLLENNRVAVEVIKDGLLKLGLITDKNSNQHRTWFMHGTSHWLGMNVHDVGLPAVKFELGMVFTVEPGIYIRPDALDNLPKTPENEKFIAAVRPAFEKYKNIGVRIEDDLVVTADGYRNLSAALPRTIPDIESFIARAQREVRAEALPSGRDRLGFRYFGLYSKSEKDYPDSNWVWCNSD